MVTSSPPCPDGAPWVDVGPVPSSAARVDFLVTFLQPATDADMGSPSFDLFPESE